MVNASVDEDMNSDHVDKDLSSDDNDMNDVNVTEDNKEEMINVIRGRPPDCRLPAWTCNATDGVHGPGPQKRYTLVPGTSSDLGPLLWHAIKHLKDDVRGPGPPLWSWMTVLWSACQIIAHSPPDPWPPPVVTLCCLIILLKCWTMKH